MIRVESGRLAKIGGHIFENTLANHLSITENELHEVHGSSKTKIDIQNKSCSNRYSVKNPSGKNTQIGLITQKKFIEYMGIDNVSVNNFITKFFGGNEFSNYDRHRMTSQQIPDIECQSFLNMMNNSNDKIYKLLFTHGYNQYGDVNYLIWANKKDDVNSIEIVNLKDFWELFKTGSWILNDTTLSFMVNNKKVLHLQMKGSGKKYSNGYHGMQFHLHNTLFDANDSH